MDSKSVCYENRTKLAKCRGLETTAPRETISGFDGVCGVRRCVREAYGYWALLRARKPERTLVSEGLAVEAVFYEPVSWAEFPKSCPYRS